MSHFNSINKTGLNIVKKFEGFSPRAYLCPANKLTIGFGHVILASEKFTTINQKQAEDILFNDLNFAISAVNELAGMDLNHNQFSALVSFVFNLGRGAFASSSLLKAVNAGKHLDVPAELVKWRMAAGTPLKGLVLRRLAEATLYLS